MNSKWEIHRVGLINFWYYDEEEFYFLQGRMLLRGANGSGKSVTMQSFIPLLLDGNMRPERLDPFGSRARKIENYLLEEGDEREERIAYLYMELKRIESEMYTTIGIGMRARKNKKMDIWYFGITDGRRIGKDFFLYKEKGEKISLTKIELKNRIGEGGKVFDTQKEYAQYVNRVLFGFETMEEYRELLDLLIQLRTPKLSKEFKPSIINDILSSSLQTLSEDDLRPMSEAIENMDGLKINLDAAKESVKAAKQIQKVYHQYNQIVLYNKAFAYNEKRKQFRKCEEKECEFGNKLEQLELEREIEKTHYEELEREERVLKKEKQSLDQNDAFHLKEQENDCLKEINALKKQQQEKNNQLAAKKEKRIQIESNKKQQTESGEEKWSKLEEVLEQMEEELEDISFDEFIFMKDNLMQYPEQSYPFSMHIKLLEDYTSRIEKGVNILEKERQVQERYSQFLEELDKMSRERDHIQREQMQYDNLLHEIKGELVEKLYHWGKESQELDIDSKTLQKISRMIEDYYMGEDYAEIKNCIREHYYEGKERIQSHQREIIGQIHEVQEKIVELDRERNEWEEKKDPEPERTEEVKKNREYLKENKIPFLPFYQAVDFESSLGTKQAAILEEALLKMGVLDALIIEPKYREQVQNSEAGICDQYIFTNPSSIQQNLKQVLKPDSGNDDHWLDQNILNVLTSIGWNSEIAQTWIDSSGNYRLGVLEGTITKTYQPRYIGVHARETYRKERIEQLIRQKEFYILSQQELEQQRIRLDDRKQQLETEWINFPSVEDMKLAAKELNAKEQELELCSYQIQKQQEKLEKQREELEKTRSDVQKICSKIELTIRLDVFHQALSHLKVYQEKLVKVQLLHAGYQNDRKNILISQEYLEEIDRDIDDILYEIGMVSGKLKTLQHIRDSIQKQLSLTNYESIKEQLDYCMERLEQIPKEKEKSVQQNTYLNDQKMMLIKEREANKIELEKVQNDYIWMQKAFELEYQLGYINTDFISTTNLEEQVQVICKTLSGKFGNKKQIDLLGNVQETYHQNRAGLLEYNLTIQTLFEELDQENERQTISVKRIDIVGKYRGVTVRLNELIEKLEQDVLEQTQLLSEKDRELFEDILANTISKKIRSRIQASKRWIEKMNQLMESMQTSSGLKLRLCWKSKRADKEEQLDTKELVQLLQKDVEIMKEEEITCMSKHFRSKIQEARKTAEDVNITQSFHMIMKDVLDYRQWFEFQLECQKTGERKKELTDRVFFTFSGGEKAMAMYVPLFSAVVAKYAGARNDAPRLISLDEAFAGVDEMNIKDMFRLMVKFEFNFMINSQILWGDYETVPALAIYQLVRPENAKYVTVISYIWNGKSRSLVSKIKEEKDG